jgi:formylglycine-generating enzyme required for sulfatase activity
VCAQLIDRLSEFIKQVETEQKFSKSGEITDARIAELAASCGAQKICVISVTIEGDYLYVAARIIDVVSKLSSEKPVHSVMISDFYIGETEVTQALWKAVMGARTNQSHWYGDRLPVEKVRWTDCKEFILHLNSFLAEQLPEGYCFALPSEAQWEYCDGNRLWFSSCFSPSLAHLH